MPGEDAMEDKADNKGKVTPWHMIHSEATPSMVHQFLDVLLPFSPCKGHATRVARVVVGGIGGHMKLEPSTKLIRREFPTI